MGATLKDNDEKASVEISDCLRQSVLDITSNSLGSFELCR